MKNDVSCVTIFYMEKRNFEKLMRGQIEMLDGKKRLLLHCCCAPCSSACLERLKDYFDVTVFFYNPNIEDGEYGRRKAELVRFISQTKWADILDCDYEPYEFYKAVRGLEDCPEGGERCVKCFSLRLSKTFEAAKKYGYDFFGTTLTVSPLKNAAVINSIGESLGGNKWLYSDFKKKNGYLRSCELSKEYSLYRQDFCGCIFSRRERPKT